MPESLYDRLDATDQAIVIALRRDGRRPFREIARELGVSESMVRKRAHRLLDDGWMRILAISDPLALGVPVVATTYAKVRPSALDATVERLARYESVRYVAVCVGANNLLVESLHGSNAELHAFLQAALGDDGVESYETMQVVAIAKSVWDWELGANGAPAPQPPEASGPRGPLPAPNRRTRPDR
ncbi:MAG: Lrp/AsnC family transcriptional regulator [Trueperaceae bacterium]|nr:Lrp/AsnC family transcriptional regulator [Trueperaceae bacterium]